MATVKVRDDPARRSQSHNAADLFYARHRGATFEDWQAITQAMIAMFKELGATDPVSMAVTANFAFNRLQKPDRLINKGLEDGSNDLRIIIR